MADKKRVVPYGFGKTFVQVEMNELPIDIQEAIIKRFEKRNDKAKVTKDTKTIVMCCEDICAYEKE